MNTELTVFMNFMSPNKNSTLDNFEIWLDCACDVNYTVLVCYFMSRKLFAKGLI